MYIKDSSVSSLVFARTRDLCTISRKIKKHAVAQILAEVSTGLGKAMVGVSDIEGDAVNFRGREGGGQIPKKRKLEGVTETQLYGSSWEA